MLMLPILSPAMKVYCLVIGWAVTINVIVMPVGIIMACLFHPDLSVLYRVDHRRACARETLCFARARGSYMGWLFNRLGGACLVILVAVQLANGKHQPEPAVDDASIIGIFLCWVGSE